MESLTSAVRQAVEAKGTSAVALVVALVVAAVVSSSAFVTATTALNVVLEARDDRSALRRRLSALAATLVVILLSVGAIITVFLGGTLATAVFGVIGLGESAADVWAVVRFPTGALLTMTGFAWTYYAAPTVAEPRWRWISLGAAVAVLMWPVASVGLFVFAANFDTYNTTYGVFASAILLLVWLWLTNIAMLFGAEVNAAGRYAEAMGTPLSPAGHSPERAQHEAARRTEEVGSSDTAG